MAQELYSVEQVADLLGLNVRTIRSYVRDGRLKAVRIGKQYRIARDDLEALTGHPVSPPAAETAIRHFHVEVSSIVQIDAISPDRSSRVSNHLMAATSSRGADEPLRVQTIYDEERARLKIIVLGDPATTAALLQLISALLEGAP